MGVLPLAGYARKDRFGNSFFDHHCGVLYGPRLHGKHQPIKRRMGT